MTTRADPRIDIRLLRDADVEAVDEMSSRAMDEMDRTFGLTVPERDAARIALSRARIRHIAATDPEGSVVAERDGEIVGVALAVRRGSLWFLSLLAVRTGMQSAGIGRRVLDAALDYGRDCALGMIGASPDPRALRRYGRAGFALYPGYYAEGIPIWPRRRLGSASARATGIVTRSWSKRWSGSAAASPTALTSAICVERGIRLLVRDGAARDDRAICLLRDSRITMVAGASEQAAHRVLWSAMAEAPGRCRSPTSPAPSSGPSRWLSGRG